MDIILVSVVRFPYLNPRHGAVWRSISMSSRVGKVHGVVCKAGLICCAVEEDTAVFCEISAKLLVVDHIFIDELTAHQILTTIIMHSGYNKARKSV